MKTSVTRSQRKDLPKAPTNILGLDEITGGGLPRGRPTLLCGGAGCGKTLLAMEFLVHGATKFKEPGVFISFEETEEELTANVASLGFDVGDLVRRKKIWLEHIHIDRGEIEQSGAYDLEGLFIRIHYAIESIGAKRVVLDTVESLFSGLPNPHILRAELRRLLRWLKNSTFDLKVQFSHHGGQMVREEFLIGKKYPVNGRNYSTSLDVGFVRESPDEYSGVLRDRNKSSVTLLVRPSIEF